MIWFFATILWPLSKPCHNITNHCLYESSKIRAFVYWLIQIFVIFRYNVVFVREKPFPKKKLAAENMSRIWSHYTFLNFRGQFVMVPKRSCVYYGLCVLGMEVLWKTKKRFCFFYRSTFRGNHKHGALITIFLNTGKCLFKYVYLK